MYMDDIILISKNLKELKKQVKVFKKTAKERGMIINHKKTKIMIKNNEKQIINWAKYHIAPKIKNETSIKYLGVWMAFNRFNSRDTHSKKESTSSGKLSTH